ncbi:hypothetical protein Tco_0058525 [Tanacetum coccineum]
MDEGFIATTYPNVQENLKLPVKEQVILEEPASSTRTLSSLKHLTKDFSSGDQFFNDKPSDAENEKTTAETKDESMVYVTIHQDTSAIPPMTSPVIDLISRPDSPNEHQPLPATTTATATTTTTITTLPLPPQPQQSTTDSILIMRIGELEQIMANLIQDNEYLKEILDSHGSHLYKLENLNITHQVSKAVDEIVTDVVDWAIQAPLRDRFRDLPEADMKEILHQRMWETNSYKAHEDHKKLYEALEKSMDRDHTDQLLTDLAEARRKKKRRHDSPKTPPGSPPHQPPPPPPPAGPSGTSGSSGASGSTAAPSSSKTAASAEYTAWTTTDTRFKPSVSSIPEDLPMNDDSAPDEQVHSSDDEDIGSDHIPKVNLKQDWWKPLPEEDRPATPEPAWSIPSSDLPVPINNWASALASTYAPPPENSLLAQTGDMAIFMDWYCKKQGITELKQKDLEGPAFEIVKVFHPNVIHLQYQMEECHKLLTDKVDDAIIRYNVSKPLPLGGQPGQVTIQMDFFFNKDLEYLRYGSKGGRPALSISKMKAAYYPDVGLEQMVPDQMWIEEECKYDIAAMYGISHWWFQRQRFYIDKHTSEGDRKAVWTHMDKYEVQMIMRFNEIHKFSDGTLQQIDEALDYRVKEFKDGKVRYSFPRSRQSRRDLPRDNPLVSVEVLSHGLLKGVCENKGIVRTEMELVLETYPTGGTSMKSRTHNEDGNPSRRHLKSSVVGGHVMDAPTIPVSFDSSEGNFGDTPTATDDFPTRTIVVILASLGEAIRGIHEYLQGVPIEEDMSTLRFRMSMIEAENASLRGKIMTMEAIKTVTHSQERRTRREVEQQLASIQKSQRQD